MADATDYDPNLDPELYDDDPAFSDDQDFDDDEDFDDCALDFETGQCGNAGTEWCDWKCRLSSSQYFAGSTAWWHVRGKLAPWERQERARIYKPGQPWPKTYRYRHAYPLDTYRR